MYLDVFNAAFPAKITGSTSSGGTWKYAWSEQRVVPTSGALETASEGRSGTTSVGYAVEMNNSEVATDTYVWMRVRASITGDLVYDFMAPDGTLAGGDSIATVSGYDAGGSPVSYTNISGLGINGVAGLANSVNAQGMVLTNPSAGNAAFEIGLATLSYPGFVSIAAQSIAGIKTLRDGLIVGTSGGSETIKLGGATYHGMLSIMTTGMDIFGVDRSGSGDQLRVILNGNTHTLEIQSNDGVTYFDSAYAVYDSTNTLYTGAYATVSGLVFKGGLYISGSLSIDELAQDAVGAMVADTDTINVTYTDATPELKWDVRYQMSITSDASGIKLSGDAASPGNSYFYGTNGSGTKGWYATSTISAGMDINGLTANDIDVADEIPNYDTSAAANRKITVKRLAGYVNPGVCDFRLSLSSTQAVPVTDQSAKGTLYWLPYQLFSGVTEVGTARVALYDGTRWNLHTSAQISLALTITSGSNYDVFVYDNAGTLTLELSSAWTTDTGRADNLDTQDGVLVKDGTTTRRYVGTLRASAANQTDDSSSKRFLWNMYHRVQRHMIATDGTDSWNYTTDTWRSANNSTSNRYEFVIGVPLEGAFAFAKATTSNGTATSYVSTGIGINSTSSNDATVFGCAQVAGNHAQPVAFVVYLPRAGYSYHQWLERAQTGGTTTWYGDAGVGGNLQNGLVGMGWF